MRGKRKDVRKARILMNNFPRFFFLKKAHSWKKLIRHNFSKRKSLVNSQYLLTRMINKIDPYHFYWKVYYSSLSL